MNVLIAADMEGIAGIDDCGDCLPSHPAAYRRGRRLMTDELLNAIAGVFRTSQVSREYRQLAKLLPAGHDSRLRAAQRRLGSLLATPVMRSKERRWLAASG